MPILDLQRRLAEVGRIRIGQQVTASNGKSRPAKLDTFRLTSSDRRRITEAAKLYGGTPREWQAPAGRQWELITEVDQLPVVVPPSEMAFSQSYELWSAGGCQRRCDSVTETISDGDCLCDPDNRECAIHSRLSVMLRDLPGLGVWRLDTSGYYAAVELQGAVEVVRLAAGHGQMLPAVLRLEQRMVKREGQTRRFAVPVLDIDISPAQLLGGHRDPLDAGTIAIKPPPTTVLDMVHIPPEVARERLGNLTPVPDTPEQPVATIAEQATATKPARKPRKNAQQPIPPTGLKPRTAAQARADAELDSAVAVVTTIMQRDPVDFSEPKTQPPEDLFDTTDQPEPITPAQLKKLSILLREQFGTDTETKHAWTAAAINRNIDSAKDLTKYEASAVIDTLENNQV